MGRNGGQPVNIQTGFSAKAAGQKEGRCLILPEEFVIQAENERILPQI